MHFSLPKNICFVDLETTGSSHLNGSRILEIGIVRTENHQVVKEYSQLINPQVPIPYFIQKITGIREEDIFLSPNFSQIKNNILDILKNSIFVSHNVNFDYNFLKTEFAIENINFEMPNFCSAQLSRYLFSNYKKHSLDIIIKRYNFSCTKRHRALADAKTIWQFYQYIYSNISPKKIKKAISFVQRKIKLFENILQSSLNNLPQNQGIYLFLNKDKKCIYIDESENIKNSIFNLQFKNSLSLRNINLFKKTYQIKFQLTAGTFGRKIRKYMLIQLFKPKYNYNNLSQNYFALTKFTDNKGFYKTKFSNIKNLKKSDIPNILVIKNSLKKIQVIQDQTNRKLKKYSKNLQKHNLQFIKQFQKNKIKTWPFKNKIKYVEKNSLSNLSETFIIKNWIIESLKNNYDDKLKLPKCFDYKIYKIIKTEIFQKNPNSKIIEIF